MAFFGSFLHAPPAALRHIPLDFGKRKLLRWCIYHVTFIYIWLIIPEFSNFKCFHTSRKYHFRVPSGWFFGRKNLKWCQIRLKFWPVTIQSNASNTWRFLFHSWKTLETEQKNLFLAHFERFFADAFLRPTIYAPTFLSKNSRYIILVRFIIIASVVANL